MRRIGAGTLVWLTVGMALGGVPAHAADPCANAAYRGGAAANLPECRAWEQVSPASKGGGQVSLVFNPFASPSGDSVVFHSYASVAGAQGAPYHGAFASTRGPAWATVGLNPPLDPLETNDLLFRPTIGYSEDNTKVFVISPRKLTTDAQEGASNLYARDISTGAASLLASVPGLDLYQRIAALGGSDAGGVFYGATPDLSRVAFTSELALAPGALAGAPNLYDVGGGQLRLASRDVDQTPISLSGRTSQITGLNPVSTDGRRITFTQFGGATSGVYQRVDGTSTVLISRSHRVADQPAPPVNATGWPSADGKQVTFSTGDLQSLTDAGPPSALYRWSAAGDTLVNLFAGVTLPWGPSANAFGISRVSSDGRYVWFTFSEQDANANTFGRLAVLDTGAKRIDVRATLENGVSIDPYTARFSPDGTKLVLPLRQALTQYEQANPACQDGACAEAFLVDATRPDAAPECASCGPAGTRSVGDVGLGVNVPGLPTGSFVTNGGRVYFDTPQPLVAADANDLADVYEYRPGGAHALISSGVGEKRAFMATVTPSGRDVFFLTADGLVPQDADDAIDLYDARVGGGLAAQQVAPGRAADTCVSANCPAFDLATPAPVAPATSRFQAPRAAPAFSVGRLSSTARRRAVSTGRLPVAVRAGAAGKLTARATARVGRRTVTIGRASLRVRRAGRYTLVLELSRASRRALARGQALKGALSVSYSVATTAATQSFTLSAPRARRSTAGGAR